MICCWLGFIHDNHYHHNHQHITHSQHIQNIICLRQCVKVTEKENSENHLRDDIQFDHCVLVIGPVAMS